MGKTKIEWANYTFNPWWGCAKVSTGCKHCYAESMARRFGTEWGVTGMRKEQSETYWQKPHNWNDHAIKHNIRPKVFCASMADVFEDHQISAENNKLNQLRERLFKLIELTDQLDWLLLTKRPHNVMDMVPSGWALGGFPKNVWIGTSIENQDVCASRINTLLKIPATIRFLSVEPLIGPLDLGLRNWAWTPSSKHERSEEGIPTVDSCRLDWVIVGGESGAKARPMHPEWAKLIQEDCQMAGIPFFFKQWGAWCPDTLVLRGHTPNKIPTCELTILGEQIRDRSLSKHVQKNTITMYRVGKKASGRLLFGKEFNEFPDLSVKEAEEAEELNGLLDTKRSYMDQIEVYKKFQ